MGNLFTKKAPPAPRNCEITEQDQAILQLKTQRDKIKQFIRRKEKCMEAEREMARKLLKEGHKDRALLLLKKKRYQENTIEQTLRQLDNIDRMVHDLEFSDIQQRVVEGLREGNEALKKMNAIFDIDEIEKLMEETKEAAEYQEEIAALLSNRLSAVDIQEAEKELEHLLVSQLSDSVLPDVPNQELLQKGKGKLSRKVLLLH
uniref:Charged multivesicular body protein 6 n=1 Tax=Angiostrongylus cantonensis TaxID=6313 RepID=A0A0K0CVZ3_ANGCA